MTAAPYVKKSRGIFALLIFILFLFSDCVSHRLRRSVDVQIVWTDSLIRTDRGYAWQYSQKYLFETMNELLVAALTEEDQLRVVESKPDYIFRVDSVCPVSSAKHQRYEVPCQKEQKLLSLIVFGDQTEYTTLLVHSIGLNVYATLLNARNQEEQKVDLKSVSSEYVTQKSSSDSVNCNPYYVAGKASEQQVMKEFCIYTRGLTKYYIRQWER